MIRFGLCLLLVSGTAGLTATPGVSGQAVSVRVVDDASGLPLPEVSVQALDSAGSVLQTELTNLDGVAFLTPSPNLVAVKGSSFGYIDQSRALDAENLTIRLEAQPLELLGLTAEVEGRSGRLQFSRRRAAGEGIFLDPVDVHQKSRYGVTEVFRDLEDQKVRRTNWSWRGPSIVSGLGSGCFSYRLNNVQVRTDPGRNPWETYPLESLLPQDLMAVEIYRYFGEVPEGLRHNAAGCGLIVIWTREGWGSGG